MKLLVHLKMREGLLVKYVVTWNEESQFETNEQDALEFAEIVKEQNPNIPVSIYGLSAALRQL